MLAVKSPKKSNPIHAETKLMKPSRRNFHMYFSTDVQRLQKIVFCRLFHHQRRRNGIHYTYRKQIETLCSIVSWIWFRSSCHRVVITMFFLYVYIAVVNNWKHVVRNRCPCNSCTITIIYFWTWRHFYVCSNQQYQHVFRSEIKNKKRSHISSQKPTANDASTWKEITAEFLKMLVLNLPEWKQVFTLPKRIKTSYPL